MARGSSKVSHSGKTCPPNKFSFLSGCTSWTTVLAFITLTALVIVFALILMKKGNITSNGKKILMIENNISSKPRFNSNNSTRAHPRINISNKFFSYADLVAHYYIWKNLLPKYNDSQWIGFSQYRRFWLKHKILKEHPLDSLDSLILTEPDLTWKDYDAIILAVAHDKFKTMGAKFISALGKKNRIIYDLKYLFSKKNVDLRL